MAIKWLDWGGDVFTRAAAQKKPILLFFSTARGQELDAALAQESVSAIIDQKFVPLRVDPVERPDVFSCFGPTSAVLHFNGTVIGRLEPRADSLRETLLKYATIVPVKEGESSPDKPVWTGAVGGNRTRQLKHHGPQEVFEKVMTPWHDLHQRGKFGSATGELDQRFLLYAAAEWQNPWATEFLKALSGVGQHAEDALVLWDTFAFLGDEHFQRAALSTLGFAIGEGTHVAAGAVAHAGAAGEVYYGDSNAKVALALLRAGAVSGDRQSGERAERILHFLRTKLYDPLLGMLHCNASGRPMVHGLLADNAWSALAFTEAFLVTGHKPYRDFADEICRFLFQELWERDNGGFVTRVVDRNDVAPMRVSRVYACENAVAFEAVWRLSEMKGNANYRKWVEWGLKSAFLPDDDPGLARIQDMLARGRMDLELVGLLSEPKTEALLAAVNRLYLPRKIVSFVDPNDQDYILAHKLEAPTYPRLFACGPDLKRVADTDDPARVPEVVQALRA